MSKSLLGLGLGFLSLFLYFFVGETEGGFAAFIFVAAYFSICQYLLSRGNVDAYRKDWFIMLALDASLLVSVLIMVLVEKREVILAQGPGILIACCGGTYAGAVVASLIARRRAVER